MLRNALNKWSTTGRTYRAWLALMSDLAGGISQFRRSRAGELGAGQGARPTFGNGANFGGGTLGLRCRRSPESNL
jgi:hypothetical protein